MSLNVKKNFKINYKLPPPIVSLLSIIYQQEVQSRMFKPTKFNPAQTAVALVSHEPCVLDR